LQTLGFIITNSGYHVVDTFSFHTCVLTIIHLFLFLLHYNTQHSVFGEDALVNVSVEKKDDNDGKLAGYIRIRSKTQGIALSLGDRITSVQRGAPENGQKA
jgi:hypothetical protein